jgi:hypothetical protein
MKDEKSRPSRALGCTQNRGAVNAAFVPRG